MRLVSLLCLIAPLAAVEEFMSAFDPRPTPPGLDWRTAGEARWYAPADDRDGSGSLSMDRESAQASWLGLRGRDDEFWLQVSAARTRLGGTARLPSGAAPSGEYQDFGVGATWKHRYAGDHVVGATATATYAGQLAASAGMEWGGRGTLFTRLGLGAEGGDGLLLALSYDADRVIFADLPVLPLIAWQRQRGSWMLLLGVPFSLVSYRAEDWRVSAVVGPLPSLSAEHRLSGPWRAFTEARWARQQWLRADRVRDDDRLQLSQWEWSGGLRLGFGPLVQFDLQGGVATARRLGEADDSQDARRDGLALSAAPFAAFRARLSF